MYLAFALSATAAYSINIDIDATKVLHEMNHLYMGCVNTCDSSVDVRACVRACVCACVCARVCYHAVMVCHKYSCTFECIGQVSLG